MKTNSKSNHTFLALLAYRERHYALTGRLTGWIGRLTSPPTPQQPGNERPAVICRSATAESDAAQAARLVRRFTAA